MTTASNNPLQDDLDHVLAHAAPDLWEPLRGQTIFITGGTGFFGCWLLETFVHANRAFDLRARVVVLTRDPVAFRQKAPHLANDPAIRLVGGDVCASSVQSVRAQLGAVAPREIAYFIHAATSSDARLYARDPRAALDTIIDGTRAALDFALATGARRFLFTSSGAVYGPQPTWLSHVHEDFRAGAPDCTDPNAVYAEGKRVAETLCACARQQHGLATLIARSFAFVGPGLPLDQHFAIGNFIGDALAGRTIKIEGDGTPLRSYLYAADLALWLWTILLRGEPGRPYNVGSDDALSILQTAQSVNRALGTDVEITVARQPTPGSEVARYVPDVGRAERELGLGQTIALDEAIRRTARWHQRDRVFERFLAHSAA